MQYLSQTSIICWTQTKPQTQHSARDLENQSMWQTACHLFRRVFLLWNHLPRDIDHRDLGEISLTLFVDYANLPSISIFKKHSLFWYFSVSVVLWYFGHGTIVLLWHVIIVLQFFDCVPCNYHSILSWVLWYYVCKPFYHNISFLCYYENVLWH